MAFDIDFYAAEDNLTAQVEFAVLELEISSREAEQILIAKELQRLRAQLREVEVRLRSE